MARGKWTRVRTSHAPPEAEKRMISQRCEAFITDVLKPRFLPEIQPTEFNYPVDIFGKWHGGNYRFIQRFRSDRPEDAHDPEFDSPYARIEYMGRDDFGLSYFRHTGQWWPIYRGLSLDEALSSLETEGIFHPIT